MSSYYGVILVVLMFVSGVVWLIDSLTAGKKRTQAVKDLYDKMLKPPQEAIEACASSSENSQVSFETPRGDTLEATCKMIEGELVAVPDNAPDDMKQPPKKRS